MPRPEAVAFAERWDRDPRQVEVVLREESVEVLRMEKGVVIGRTKHGYVCANAGVDASNVGEEDTVTLLPVDSDRSAREIRERIAADLGVAVGVIVSDSFGRPWRWGIVDIALGVAGLLAAGRPARPAGHRGPRDEGHGHRRRRSDRLRRGARLGQDEPAAAGPRARRHAAARDERSRR